MEGWIRFAAEIVGWLVLLPAMGIGLCAVLAMLWELIPGWNADHANLKNTIRLSEEAGWRVHFVGISIRQLGIGFIARKRIKNKESNRP